MNQPNTFSRCRAALGTLALIAATLTVGCAVDIDEPIEDGAADVFDDATADTASAYDVADVEGAASDRDAILDELARDIELDRLSDREMVLLEIIRDLGGDPAPENWQTAPASSTDPDAFLDAATEAGANKPGGEVGP